MDFSGKTIALALTGSIAAYRSCDLVRELYRRGAHRVIAVMSESAQQFISPLTLGSLTRQPVITHALGITPDGTPEHIALAQQADALLIHPATANCIAKLANGLADDAVTTSAITFTDKPVLIAPAMNTRMWDHPITRRNLELLESLPHLGIIHPHSGLLACGENGDGHLANQETVLHHLYRSIHPYAGLLNGLRVVVTAGGTSEPIDPVRTLTNRSSGKMGVALADEAFAMGATVTLIATEGVGLPGLEARPYSVQRVSTVASLQTAIEKAFANADWLMMAAAVCDYRAASPASHKIKKSSNNPLALELAPTEDIVSRMASAKQSHQRVIGFAAESQNLLENAQTKLTQKHLDAIVANDIGRQDIGFASDENEATLLLADGNSISIAKAAKMQVAQQILVTLSQQHTAPATAAQSEIWRFQA